MALLLVKPIVGGYDRAPCASCPKERPSSLFLGFAVLLNAPSAAYAVAAGVQNSGRAGAHGAGCDDCLHTFLYVAAPVNVFMIAFAAYLYRKFPRPYSRHGPGDSAPWSRTSDICLNDPRAEVFILVVIFAAV